jgi:hypothetical protein
MHSQRTGRTKKKSARGEMCDLALEQGRCFCPIAAIDDTIAGVEILAASARKRNSPSIEVGLLLLPNLDSARRISRSSCFARKHQCGVSAVPRPEPARTGSASVVCAAPVPGVNVVDQDRELGRGMVSPG